MSTFSLQRLGLSDTLLLTSFKPKLFAAGGGRFLSELATVGLGIRSTGLAEQVGCIATEIVLVSVGVVVVCTVGHVILLIGSGGPGVAVGVGEVVSVIGGVVVFLFRRAEVLGRVGVSVGVVDIDACLFPVKEIRGVLLIFRC